MERIPPKENKKQSFSREELLNKDKNELVEEIIRLKAHNNQLKNIISKKLPSDSNGHLKVRKKQGKSFDFTKIRYVGKLYAVELGARGIPAKSLYNLLKDLGLPRTTISSLLNHVFKTVLVGSHKIWLDREGNVSSERCYYRRVLLRILYFGWDYQGYVVQEDSIQTIEHHLFHALTTACLIEDRDKSNYHRCGRTDKGVSAFGQVISITLRSKYPVDQQYSPEALTNELSYCKALNRLLPRNIRAVAWMPIPEDKPDFSARFSCNKRQYKYYFPRSTLDIEAMRNACVHLLGSNDYRNLCKMDVGNNVKEFRRELLKAEILPVQENDVDDPTSMYYLLIEGNAFLWHQIRCVMGVLLLIGQGNECPEVIAELLDVEKNPRKPQYNMALDVPLNLFHCSYDVDGTWIYDREDLRTVIEQLQSDWTLKSIQSTMIKDVIDELEKQHSSMSETDNSNNVKSDKDRVIAYADCLLQGVRPKVYKPLMERDMCSSLEERIEHYAKRRRITNPEDTK